jgi:endonuclease/exonuclease/phosphatase family metal-dependent hydrolase
MIESRGTGEPNQPSASTSGDVRTAFLIASVLAVMFGLQCLRALFPSMVYVLKDRLGVSSIGLGLMGIGLFALAGVLRGWMPKTTPLRTATVLAGFLAGLRALLQLWPGDPVGFLILAAAGAVVFLSLLASLPPSSATRIFLCGAGIDLALHAFHKTEDWHWASGMNDLVIVVLAGIALAFAFRANRAATDLEPAAWQHSRGLFVWGPYVFLHLELFGNVARMSARTGTSPEISGALLAAAHAVTIAMLAAGISRRSPWIVGAAIAALVSILKASVPGIAAIIQMPLAILACGILLDRALLRVSDAPARSIAFGFGSVLLILLTFAHYADYDLQFPWTRTHVWVTAALMLVVAAVRPSVLAIPRAASSALAAVPLALAAGLAIVGLRHDRAATQAPHAPQALAHSARIVTFNLHAGFDELGAFRFPFMMEKLVAEGADVIALQEVSRGWLINGCADLYELARSSLPMPGVFAASVGGDWGNAVFSKATMQHVEQIPLPPETLSLSRAVLAVDLVAHPSRTFRVLATHFHHRSPDDAIRVLQSQTVVAQFGTQQPAVLLGDFNATPESQPMEILRQAGWYEAPMLEGSFTYPSKAPERRIDTIVVCGPVEILDARVAPAWGSDHRAVVVDVALH